MHNNHGLNFLWRRLERLSMPIASFFDPFHPDKDGKKHHLSFFYARYKMSLQVHNATMLWMAHRVLYIFPHANTFWLPGGGDGQRRSRPRRPAAVMWPHTMSHDRMSGQERGKTVRGSCCVGAMKVGWNVMLSCSGRHVWKVRGAWIGRIQH